MRWSAKREVFAGHMIPRMGWSLLTLAGVLLALGGFLAAAVVVLMAWSLVRPPRMTDGKAAWLLQRLSPGDLNMPYEDATFDVRDVRTGEVLRLKGWWIPRAGSPGGRPADRTVVLLHGYADAKVGAIAWAPVWQRLGFNVLALDLRAHGESGGRESTAGYYERHDVEQVVGELRTARPESTRRIVLFGASMGAAVALAAAALMEGVDAIVLDSPFSDFCSASRTHMDLLGLPGGLFQSAALQVAEWLAYAKFDEVRPADLLRTVGCPVLVIAPTDDIFLAGGASEAIASALAERPATAGPAEIWHVAGAGHLLGVHADADKYAVKLSTFLDNTLDASRTAEIIVRPG